MQTWVESNCFTKKVAFLNCSKILNVLCALYQLAGFGVRVLLNLFAVMFWNLWLEIKCNKLNINLLVLCKPFLMLSMMLMILFWSWIIDEGIIIVVGLMLANGVLFKHDVIDQIVLSYYILIYEDCFGLM